MNIGNEGMGTMAADALREPCRYWIGVVSATHVKRGVAGGFAQLCHGKSAPLRRMRQNDWLIYYSPRTDMAQGKALQAFTAIGQVADDCVYEFQMSESFVPFRRNIRYRPSREVKIADVLDQLSFTCGNRNWGYSFRFGHFEIGGGDFQIIARAMLEDAGLSI
ncbi:EVE domain-containing protein [Paenibacillus terrigena]|uniref:EVE domain-containing protein n=1 Tax=Paenibacillus terrigena TaxID=369333 RepID=UPI0028D1F3DB|nr:EVE domain-containing protein [Paenibacillus terrigena]